MTSSDQLLQKSKPNSEIKPDRPPPEQWGNVWRVKPNVWFIVFECVWCHRQEIRSGGDLLYPCCYPYPSKDIAETRGQAINAKAPDAPHFWVEAIKKE